MISKSHNLKNILLIHKQEIHSINKGIGVPLFFQHGLTANVNQVEGLLGGLDGTRLLSIDCPGHGRSILEEDYLISFDSYSDEVIRNMDSNEIPKAIFGGISMGSGIALNIALRYPERVLGLVLVRPAWLDSGDPPNLSILLDAIPYMHQENGNSRFKALVSFRNIEDKFPLAAKSVLGVFGEDQQSALSKVIEGMISDHPINNLSQLGNIDIPSLVIANDDDPLHPYEMAEVINDRLPNSEIRKIVSGYIDKAQHRMDVRQYIQEFIKNLIQ
ncbi:MAG: pimeloyl-ACP methyl ester carboxylesterase [Saprospiraceae bacterium]